MTHVQTEVEVSLDSPVLIEGLPGAGLVGKIATDHIVDSFDMRYVAGIHCDGLPDVAVYHEGSAELLPPVRIYADESRDLLALQSDVPVSPSSSSEFAGCVTGWLAERDATPIYISGIPDGREGDALPQVVGLATGDGQGRLDDAGITPPGQSGLVSGPTGALLAEAEHRSLDAVGLVAETEKKFPDPQAARAVIANGIEPLTGLEVETDELVEQAEEIREARENLAKQMREADDESSEVQPIRGFQ